MVKGGLSASDRAAAFCHWRCQVPGHSPAGQPSCSLQNSLWMGGEQSWETQTAYLVCEEETHLSQYEMSCRLTSLEIMFPPPPPSDKAKNTHPPTPMLFFFSGSSAYPLLEDFLTLITCCAERTSIWLLSSWFHCHWCQHQESMQGTASLPGCNLKIEEPMLLPLKAEETLPLMPMEAEISPYLYLKC